MKASIALDTRRQKKDGSYPIVLRVSNRGQFSIALKLSAKIEEWDGNSFSKTAPNAKIKNVRLSDILLSTERYILSLQEDKRIPLDSTLRRELKDILFGNIDKIDKELSAPETVVECFDKFIEDNPNHKYRTVEAYRYTQDKLTSHDKRASFDDITVQWLTKWEDKMRREGLSTNTISIHLRNLRTVFNYAIDNEYTTLYPFRRYRIKEEATRKRNLTIELIKKLRDYPCDAGRGKYRDMFLLIFYLRGINAVDLFQAKELINGRLEYKRAKTGKLYSVKIEPEAMAIIEKYKGKNYLLNIMDTNVDYKNFLRKMNKRIMSLDPMFKNVTSYWARHSWATIASSLDIPKDTISAGLGHNNGSRVTDIYIDFDEKKVDEANRKILDAIK